MKVIVIGRNYTSRLGMIRALGQCGYDVYVVRTLPQKAVSRFGNKDVDGYSKYVKGYFVAIEPNRENLISVIKSIRNVNSSEKDILIPVDDFSASTIDEYNKQLKNDFYFPHISMQQGAITQFMDKSLQKKYASELGLNVAKGCIIKPCNGSYDIPKDLTFPCFPKPLISFKGNKQCMKKCNNEKELREAMDKVLMFQKDCPFEIEEFISIEKEYATLGFSDGKSIVLPAMIQLLRDGSGSHKGVTMLGRVITNDSFKEFFRLLESFILKIGFVGLFDIDSYESNGKLYFNELNLRFGASGYAITASGVNLPSMYVNNALGIKNNFNIKLTVENNFVNEKVVLDDYFAGYINKCEYKELMSSAKIKFIECNEDPIPYYIFRFKVIKSYLKKTIKQLFKK